jgi:hypothetical protein
MVLRRPNPSMIEPMTETTGFMLGFVLSLLAPFLAAGSITDPALIRLAAAETIAAYNAPSPDRLIAIAQTVAFALTSVDNLRLSLPAGLSLSMKLKLRGNANALQRSAQRRTHLARIGALSTIASTLGAGQAPPLKARLLGTTALYG